MHTLVRGAEGVAGFFQQLFLKGEVGERVINQLFQHDANFLTAATPMSVIELVDQGDDAMMLLINDIDTGIKLWLPDQKCYE